MSNVWNGIAIEVSCQVQNDVFHAVQRAPVQEYLRRPYQSGLQAADLVTEVPGTEGSAHLPGPVARTVGQSKIGPRGLREAAFRRFNKCSAEAKCL